MLNKAFESDWAKIYKMDSDSPVERYIATTPETRAICNDPKIAGIDYTDKLQQACVAVLKTLDLNIKESSGVVVNILRGGLNYGLRHALHDAFGWNRHTTCFISAQRARDNADPEEWHITENAYRKVYLPRAASLFIGDVVATGTSLRYGLNDLIFNSCETGQIDRITEMNLLCQPLQGFFSGRVFHIFDHSSDIALNNPEGASGLRILPILCCAVALR